MKGTTCIVTGANSGIGRVTSTALAKMGAKVLIVCRDPSRGDAAKARIIADSGNSDVELLLADLSSQRQLRELAASILRRHDRVDVLINNAGMLGNERRVTEDGIEQMFAVNHLAPFLLTNLLLDAIRRSPQGRVVTLASEVHRWAKFDPDNLQAERGYGGYKQYCVTKLANVMFTAELARRLQGSRATANCLHPGVVGSNFGSGAAWWMRVGMALGRPFLRTAEKGAETVLYLACSPEVAEQSGKYWMDKKIARSAPEASDVRKTERLWEISTELVGLGSSTSTAA